MTNTKTHWKQLSDYDYLGAYSLSDGQELTLTIRNIRQDKVKSAGGKEDVCIIADFMEEEKPMILNKTNCKIIEDLHKTPIVEEWIGKKITLYVTTTSFMGDVVDCLRIRPYLPAKKQTIKCQSCKAEILPAHGMSAEDLAQYTLNKYGKKLCAICATQVKKEQDADEQLADMAEVNDDGKE